MLISSKDICSNALCLLVIRFRYERKTCIVIHMEEAYFAVIDEDYNIEPYLLGQARKSRVKDGKDAVVVIHPTINITRRKRSSTSWYHLKH